MNLNSAIKELEKALMDSQEFVNLARAKKEVSKSPKMASLLSAFDKKQETLRASDNLRPDQMQTMMDEIRSDYDKLGSIPEIKRYFNAMGDFDQLLLNVVNRIQDSLGEEIG